MRKHRGFYCEDDWALSQIAQRGCRVSIPGDGSKQMVLGSSLYVALLDQEGWTRWPPEFPSNLSHSLTPCIWFRETSLIIFISSGTSFSAGGWSIEFLIGCNQVCMWQLVLMFLRWNSLWCCIQYLAVCNINGNGMHVLHAQICWDQKYVENLTVIYL